MLCTESEHDFLNLSEEDWQRIEKLIAHYGCRGSSAHGQRMETQAQPPSAVLPSPGHAHSMLEQGQQHTAPSSDQPVQPNAQPSMGCRAGLPDIEEVPYWASEAN